MKISTILNQIDAGAIALPVFQRGYVWNRDQVRGLMTSLYKRHPVGSLLTWITRTENADARGEGPLQAGYVKLILDGQQRITSLYGIDRGHAPPFFEGNPATFTGLFFNFIKEEFQFYAPIRMRQEVGWVSVTELMQKSIDPFIEIIQADPSLAGQLGTYIGRLNKIFTIGDIELHAEDVTGEDKSVDDIVEIFNRVNSGGTKLTKGDLALAKICAAWPDARKEMNARLDKWGKAGFYFSLDWLLRCVNSLVTGEALFAALDKVSAVAIQEGLKRSEKHIDYLLNLIASRLGLDHSRVLKSVFAFPLMIKYLDKRGGTLANHKERDRLLYWYIHTLLWGRYSTSTETVLNQDLEAIEDIEEGLDRLVAGLRRDRGDLTVTPVDFDQWSMGSRFYPLLYMLTRVSHARDWDTGIELSSNLLGIYSNLELHHIFPKARLYEAGYAKAEVNALANFTFLTKETNLKVWARYPSEYIPAFLEQYPDAIESHWIPMDPELWKIENYPKFLEARRALLADATNNLLRGLYEGSAPEGVVVPMGGIAGKEEEQVLLDINIWISELGLPEGEFGYEVTDMATGELLATLDLAWPNGMQEGYSQPVALLIDEPEEVWRRASHAGFRAFTDADSLKIYVKNEILRVKASAA